MVGNHQTSIYKWLALGFQVLLRPESIRIVGNLKANWCMQALEKLDKIGIGPANLKTKRDGSG